MSNQSRMHPYLEGAKARIDEMDATLASIERQLGKMEANTQLKCKVFLPPCETSARHLSKT